MQDYEVLLQRQIRKGKRFIIGCDPEEEKPFVVDHRGNGHYFRTLEAVLAYCCGRGWLPYGELDTLERELER